MTKTGQNTLDLSFVIPVFNESESLDSLAQSIARSVPDYAQSAYETILVDDGSTDDSWDEIRRIQKSMPSILRGSRFRRNFGKAAALQTSFNAASGAIVRTLDANLKRPAHLFGGIGLCTGSIGVIILSYLSALWFAGAGPIGNRPLFFFFGILCLILDEPNFARNSRRYNQSKNCPGRSIWLDSRVSQFQRLT